MEKGYEIKVLDHGYVKFINQMGSDEDIIEAARMSVNKGFQNWDDDAGLLEYLYANEHMTPFECGGELQIEVKAPIFIFRQWQRHRTQCLSGDTEIYFEVKKAPYKIKLKDLYEKWQPTVSKITDKQKNPYFKKDQVKNMYLRCLNEDTKTFYHTHINDVIFSGEKDVFEIELKSGKKIKCSADHKFLFDSGWGSLKNKMELQLINDKAVYQAGDFFINTNGEFGYKNKEIPKLDQIISIIYVGKENCYDLSVDGPFHNFIANGIVTHNSFNEMSARYTKMPDEHYLPEIDRLTIQGKTNKQGSSEKLLPLDLRNEFINKMKLQQDEIYSCYEESVKNKFSREIARLNCPVSRYSKMRAKTDLRNWLNFLKLRSHSHAQWEIREYANAVAQIVKHFWPRTHELFEEYTLGAVTLNRTEVVNLKKYFTETKLNISNKDSYDPSIIEKILKKINIKGLL